MTSFITKSIQDGDNIVEYRVSDLCKLKIFTKFDDCISVISCDGKPALTEELKEEIIKSHGSYFEDGHSQLYAFVKNIKIEKLEVMLDKRKDAMI